MIPIGFKGRALALAVIDIGRIGRRIGVGEGEIRASSRWKPRAACSTGRAQDAVRTACVLARLDAGQKRTAAEGQGLAYAKWGARPYPADSSPGWRWP